MNDLIAVDLGNSRAKFGRFTDQPGYPFLLSMCADETPDLRKMQTWLAEQFTESTNPLNWLLAKTGGVHEERLRDWIRTNRGNDTVDSVVWTDLPMRLEVEFPEKTGIDRLLAAYGAIRWRALPENAAPFDAQLPMLVIDVGTAITVDLVSADGVFCGGAILPGLSATAAALARISSRLPEPNVADIPFAVYPGRTTEEALAAGVYWGAVGAIRQCYELVCSSLGSFHQRPLRLPLFFTGGGGAGVLRNGLAFSLPSDFLIELPELVLAGIALTFRR